MHGPHKDLWLSPKPDELLHKEVPSSYNRIIKTLNHIPATDKIQQVSGFRTAI